MACIGLVYQIYVHVQGTAYMACPETWCKILCTCRVLRAFPVKELVTEDDSINAEMDPEDVFRVTENIQGHHQMT